MALGEHTVWGGPTMLVGPWLFICATRKSDGIPYRWVVARSSVTWAARVYRFHQVSGGLVVLFGISLVLGIVGRYYVRSGGVVT